MSARHPKPHRSPVPSKLITLGYSIESNRKVGFHSASTEEPGSPIQVGSELSILTVAPTGAGKGTGSIVPTLLTNSRPAIAIDPKGELYEITARARRAMGHEVYVLDPFNVRTRKPDTLNPLDLLSLSGVSAEAESMMLAEAIGHDFQSTKEFFWDSHAKGILSGLIFLSTIRPYLQSLGTIRDHLVGEDPIHKIATALDFLTEKNLVNTLAYRELSAFINQSERETRPSVLASAGTYMKIFNDDKIVKAVEKSTIKLKDIADNKPLTIYLIFESNKLHSHRALLRLWLSTAMTVVMARRTKPEDSMLFMLDECGQLGNFELLETVLTLCRGFGVQAWMFFQSLHQLKGNYERSWRTILDNVGAVQAFGFPNKLCSSEWSEFFGLKSDTILSIPKENQLLYIRDRGIFESRRLNYLTDAQFEGLFDPNPYYRSGERS